MYNKLIEKMITDKYTSGQTEWSSWKFELWNALWIGYIYQLTFDEFMSVILSNPIHLSEIGWSIKHSMTQDEDDTEDSMVDDEDEY